MRNLFPILFFPVFVSAQSNPVGPARFDNTWLNGDCTICEDTLFGGTTMTFDAYPPIIVREHKDMDFDVTNASFSDQDGNLLAYTNGYYIANTLNDTMMNGDSINPDYSIHQDRLYQGAVFLPQPENDSIIYLFHEQLSLDPTSVPYGFVFLAQYSVVDIIDNDNLGKVLKKNIPLVQDTLCYGKITATRHGNGRDWWVIIPAYSEPLYYTYLLTPHGIDTILPQIIGNPFFSDGGQAVFTPSGSKYIKINGLSQESWVDILDFDRCTGRFSNYQGFHKNEGGVTGVSVSLNSRYLYASIGVKIYQYDLWADNISASETLVGEVVGLATNVWMSQLAPDGKIYIGATVPQFHYHVIHKPNEQGVACNFEPFGFYTITYSGWSIPTFPYYRLGPLDGSPCDTLDINNLPIADFRIDSAADTFGFHFVDLSYYNPTAWHWDFGDGAQSAEQHPSHTYALPGEYLVCLTASNEYAADTICKVVIVEAVSSFKEPDAHGYYFSAVPNPANDYLNIRYAVPQDATNLTVQLFSTTGMKAAEERLAGTEGTQQIDLSRLSAGLYYLRFIANGKLISVQKIVVVH